MGAIIESNNCTKISIGKHRFLHYIKHGFPCLLYKSVFIGFKTTFHGKFNIKILKFINNGQLFTIKIKNVIVYFTILTKNDNFGFLCIGPVTQPSTSRSRVILPNFLQFFSTRGEKSAKLYQTCWTREWQVDQTRACAQRVHRVSTTSPPCVSACGQKMGSQVITRSACVSLVLRVWCVCSTCVPRVLRVWVTCRSLVLLLHAEHTLSQVLGTL